MIKKQSMDYYDLFEILKTMEKNGHLSGDEVWEEYVCEWGIKNDSIIYLGFGYYDRTNKADKYSEYFKEVNKLLGLDESNEGIFVEVSW